MMTLCFSVMSIFSIFKFNRESIVANFLVWHECSRDKVREDVFHFCLVWYSREIKFYFTTDLFPSILEICFIFYSFILFSLFIHLLLVKSTPSIVRAVLALTWSISKQKITLSLNPHRSGVYLLITDASMALESNRKSATFNFLFGNIFRSWI